MERDCTNCIRNAPEKGCTSWDCDYINRKEAINVYMEFIEAYREKHKGE